MPKGEKEGNYMEKGGEAALDGTTTQETSAKEAEKVEFE